MENYAALARAVNVKKIEIFLFSPLFKKWLKVPQSADIILENGKILLLAAFPHST